MQTADEAHRLIETHLGQSPRANHSRMAGRIMRGLAGLFAADADLWEVVGLCHDLDYLDVDGDWIRHGPTTARWLAGRLPADALQAIAAHDHRAGVAADTAIADGLRLADAITVMAERIGGGRVRAALADDNMTGLRDLLAPRTFLVDTVATIAARRGIVFGDLAAVVPAYG